MTGRGRSSIAKESGQHWLAGDSDRRIQLWVLVLFVWQGLLHAAQLLQGRDPRLAGPHGVSLACDGLLLVVSGLAVRALLRARPAGWGRPLEPMALTVLALAGASLSTYPLLLGEFLAFPVNLFGADAGSARAFLLEYAGIRRLWPAGVALLLGGLALCMPPRFRVPGPCRWVLALSCLLALPTLFRTSPHPLVYGLQEQLRSTLSPQPRAVRALQRPTPGKGAPGEARQLAWMDALSPSSCRKVFLVVLEGVPARDFESSFLARRDGFSARVADRSLYFANYHATNLDSYTSLLAMLTSVQVPYRAYADVGLYQKLDDADNLVRRLRKEGFWTLFLSTYEVQPFVPNRSDWDRVMDRKDLGDLKGWVSLGGNRMEAATEDRAGLGPLVELACSHDRAFVLHELVYGHSPRWRSAAGLTQLDYYDAYLRELQDRLEAKGVARESLIVVVSDHGDRARAGDAENYRVPLLVVGPSGKGGRDGAFRTHLDLPALVASFLRGGPLPEARPTTFVVGSTERWIYGQLDASGSHLLLDDRTGRALSSKGTLDPPEVRDAFQRYLEWFDARHGRQSP